MEGLVLGASDDYKSRRRPFGFWSSPMGSRTVWSVSPPTLSCYRQTTVREDKPESAKLSQAVSPDVAAVCAVVRGASGLN
jgi:hypothetical protein